MPHLARQLVAKRVDLQVAHGVDLQVADKVDLQVADELRLRWEGLPGPQPGPAKAGGRWEVGDATAVALPAARAPAAR